MSSQSVITVRIGEEAFEVTVTVEGTGRPLLLLHGGGGPSTILEFGELLGLHHHQVVTPTHPGFNSTPRPESLNSVGTLAWLYVEMVNDLGLEDVTVVGNGIGGWVAAEMAVLAPTRVSSYVIVGGVGIQVRNHPVLNHLEVPPADVADLTHYEPEAFRVHPASLPTRARHRFSANRRALEVYGGDDLTDPGLRRRLASVHTPTLVIWGEADQIADPEYGQALAAAIPGARFELLPWAGHLPQQERPEELAALIDQFAVDSALTH